MAVLAIFPKETAASVTSETTVRQKSSLYTIRLQRKNQLQIPSVCKVVIDSHSKDFDDDFGNVDIDKDIIDTVKDVESIFIVDNSINYQHNCIE